MALTAEEQTPRPYVGEITKWLPKQPRGSQRNCRSEKQKQNKLKHGEEVRHLRAGAHGWFILNIRPKIDIKKPDKETVDDGR